MNILITGGAGFIGSALIRYLLSHTQHIILNVDKLTYAGNLESLRSIEHDPRYSLAQVDICNREAMSSLFAQFQPDAVMHLAAESHVDRSILGADDFIQTNIVGTFTLLEVARNYWQTLSAAKCEAFRFQHISTDEVYGDLPHPEDPSFNHQLFTESSAYQPSSPYAASKAASDHLVNAWYRTYGFPILMTNCSNNYGPYHFPEKLIPLTIFHALKHKPIPIYGDGSQIRDWLFVEDHVDALYCVLQHGKLGETYNIGGHNEVSNLTLVQQICTTLQTSVPSKIQYLDLITHVEDRLGHDKRYAIDASKIANELGWRPRHTLAQGLNSTVQWFIDNRQWCESVAAKRSTEIEDHYMNQHDQPMYKVVL